MSVLIKGMKMPDCCWNCPCIDGEYGECNISGKRIMSDKGRLADCPLVELPDHGDLIDRDELDGVLLTNGIAGAITRRKTRYTVGDVRTMVGHAPVVIPAERSESDDWQ